MAGSDLAKPYTLTAEPILWSVAELCGPCVTRPRLRSPGFGAQRCRVRGEQHAASAAPLLHTTGGRRSAAPHAHTPNPRRCPPGVNWRGSAEGLALKTAVVASSSSVGSKSRARDQFRPHPLARHPSESGAPAGVVQHWGRPHVGLMCTGCMKTRLWQLVVFLHRWPLALRANPFDA